MHAALRLAIDFDPSGLQQDLARLVAPGWSPHFNTDLYRGDWSGFALRAPSGATHEICKLHNAPGATAFTDLPAFEHCPHLRAVADRLSCEIGAVRLLRLGPGAAIGEHADHDLGHAFGEARLHVPVCTNPQVDFRVAGERIEMRPGELWYIDASRPHSVRNPGDTERVHLVIDCRVNDWLDRLLRRADNAPRAEPVVAPTLAEQHTEWAPWPLCSRYDEPITQRIIDFIREIGLDVGTCELPEQTFLPGIRASRGKLWVDPRRLRYPGDLLHEAAHLALTPTADRALAGPEFPIDGGEEMAAIAWSWAALRHLGVAPMEVFHEDGYKDDAQWLLETFSSGTFLALPMLQWLGMCADSTRAAALGVAPFPHMIRWLRD